MKNLLNKFVLFGVLLLVLSKGALATCVFLTGSTYTENDSSDFSFGNIVVQRDAPVGTVVASSTNGVIWDRTTFVQCTYEIFSAQFALGTGDFTPVSYGGQTLYESGVAGLAYRVVTPGAGKGTFGTGPLPRSISNPWCVTSTTWYRFCGSSWGALTLELVKIASTTGSGPLTTGSIVQASIAGQLNIMNFLIASGNVQTVACSVVNSNIQVNMSQTKNTDFSGVGSTSGATDFSIGLDCDASTNINMTINAGSSGAADATNGVLNLDNAGTDTASGVGVQVLYNSVPVALGSQMSIATTSTEGAFNIPMTAQYIQTEASLTPGKADANATFTMTYQ